MMCRVRLLPPLLLLLLVPIRLPPHQGLRLPRSLTGPPFKRKFGETSF